MTDPAITLTQSDAAPQRLASISVVIPVWRDLAALRALLTLGASFCSFHCTHCYLPKNANEVPLPSLAQMKEQIDANRRFLGPGGGLQLTGGDVADAYWRSGRADESEDQAHGWKV